MRVRKEGNHAVLEVSDNGPGLAKEEDVRVWERFPHARTELAEEFKDGERLLRRPVGIDQEAQSARQTRWRLGAAAHGFFSWRAALRVRRRPLLADQLTHLIAIPRALDTDDIAGPF